MSSRIIPSLPKLKVPIGIKPQRLKLPNMENPAARLEALRYMVCDVIREERREFKSNRAVECQPYVERLLQLAIYRGSSDAYTRGMLNWWLLQSELYDKIFDVLVPRFTKLGAPYTALYNLPKVYVPGRLSTMNQQYRSISVSVLELRGNPFPSVELLEARRKEMLKDFVKRGINDDRLR